MFRRKYKVHVEADSGEAKVVLARSRFYVSSYILVARINMTADDADEKLSEARAKASGLAYQTNQLEREKIA